MMAKPNVLDVGKHEFTHGRTPRGCVGKTEQQNAAPPKKDGAASCYLDFS